MFFDALIVYKLFVACHEARVGFQSWDFLGFPSRLGIHLLLVMTRKDNVSGNFMCSIGLLTQSLLVVVILVDLSMARLVRLTTGPRRNRNVEKAMCSLPRICNRLESEQLPTDGLY